MEIKKIIDIVCDCSDEYAKNLVHKNLLFVFCFQEKLYGLEAVFHKPNFLHLTGLETKHMNAEVFFSACRSRKLSPKDIVQPVKSTVGMKLQVLRNLTNIHATARMLGDYNQNGIKLKTDKLVGHTVGCLGFKIDRKTGFLFPNTALKEDIRKMVLGAPCKIVAILRKPVSAPLYNEITYTSTGIDFSELMLPADIASLIEPRLLSDEQQEVLYTQEQTDEIGLC